MPAVGNPDPDSLTDASQDIAAVNALVTDAIADGNDVLVIPHSWGGYVVGSALQGLSKAERAQEGKRGGVVRCAYMAAYMLDEGFTWDMKTLPEFIRVEVCLTFFSLFLHRFIESILHIFVAHLKEFFSQRVILILLLCHCSSFVPPPSSLKKIPPLPSSKKNKKQQQQKLTILTTPLPSP